MAKVDVNGLGIAYESIGTGDKTIANTPGGRFPKETPGVRELATELAGKGYKALIWDRPNCGESDISFDAETESVLNADLEEPPWADTEWNERSMDAAKGLFLSWPKLAPQILELAKKI